MVSLWGWWGRRSLLVLRLWLCCGLPFRILLERNDQNTLENTRVGCCLVPKYHSRIHGEEVTRNFLDHETDFKADSTCHGAGSILT